MISLIGVVRKMQKTQNQILYYFFLNARADGILRFLQSDRLWERAEFFYLVCQPRRNPSPGCVSLCNDLNFPFFDTDSVYIQLFREKLSKRSVRAFATMPKRSMGDIQ